VLKEQEMENKLVFFVDDDKMILNLLEYTFKSRAGIQVKTFFSGEECLENLHLKPDLVVLDHLFPEDTGQMSGLDVIREMRKADKNVSIIVLSSQQDENLIPEFLKVGAKQYISKDDYFIDALIESIEAEVGS
jgi:DNA-binding response OmpR family regulator